MSFTNQTPNYGLPQWIGTDSPQFLTDMNDAFRKIDDQMKINSEGGEDVSTELRQIRQEVTDVQGEITGLQGDITAVTKTANDAKNDAAAALRQVGEIGTELGEWYTYSILIKDVNPIAEGLLNVNRNQLQRIDCKYHAPTRLLIVNSDIDANRAPEVETNGTYTATIKVNVDGLGNFFPLYRLPIKTSSVNAAEKGGYFIFEQITTKFPFKDTLNPIGTNMEVSEGGTRITNISTQELYAFMSDGATKGDEMVIGSPSINVCETYLRHCAIGSYGGYLWLGMYTLSSSTERTCVNCGFGQQIYQLNQFLGLELESSWTPSTP